MVKVRPGEVELDGTVRPVGEAETVLQEAFARDRQIAEAIGTKARGWAVAIDGQTPASDVHVVLSALARLGSRDGTLVLATAPSDPLPKPRDPAALKAMGDELEASGATGPSDKATFLARKMSSILPPCPEMVKVFQALAGAAPEHKCALLAAGMGEAIPQCDCAKEDEVLDGIYAMTVGFGPPKRLATTTALVLDPEAPGAAKIPAAKPWREVVAGLDRSALVSFWFEPR